MAKAKVPGPIVFEAGGIALKRGAGNALASLVDLASILNSIGAEGKNAQIIVVQDQVWVLKSHQTIREIEVPDAIDPATAKFVNANRS